MDLDTHKARRDNVEVELNRREFLFLKLVMGEPGKYFAKATIFKAWDYRGSRPTTLLENVSRLRAKLDTGFGTRLIHNKSGKGYKIDMEG